MVISFKAFIRRGLGLDPLPELDEVYVTEDGVNVVILREGKTYNGSFDKSLRASTTPHTAQASVTPTSLAAGATRSSLSTWTGPLVTAPKGASRKRMPTSCEPSVS